MRKFLIVGSLLLSISLSAYAQQPAAPTAPNPTWASSTPHTDTVRAVHRLFRKRRVGGIVWAAIGGAFTVQILAASIGGSNNSTSTSSYNTSSNSSNPAGTAVGVIVLGGIPAGIGIGKLSRFSSARERAILANFEKGQALPHYVQRRIRQFVR